jgi:integrase
VRTGDIIGNDRDDASPMRWQHVDLKTQIWTIPKTKTNTEHRVPLSKAAMALLGSMRAVHQHGDIVFPGIRMGKPLSNCSMKATLTDNIIPLSRTR